MRYVAWGAVVLTGLVAMAAGADEVAISAKETLKLDVLPGWSLKTGADPDDQFRPSFRLAHFDAMGIKDVSVKFFINKDHRFADMQTDAVKKDFVDEDCEQMKSGSQEQAVLIRKYAAANPVYYCAFTDASMPDAGPVAPGDFRHETVAFLTYKDFGFNALLYSNTTKGALYEAALRMLSSIRVVGR